MPEEAVKNALRDMKTEPIEAEPDEDVYASDKSGVKTAAKKKWTKAQWIVAAKPVMEKYLDNPATQEATLQEVMKDTFFDAGMADYVLDVPAIIYYVATQAGVVGAGSQARGSQARESLRLNQEGEQILERTRAIYDAMVALRRFDPKILADEYGQTFSGAKVASAIFRKQKQVPDVNGMELEAFMDMLAQVGALSGSGQAELTRVQRAAPELDATRQKYFTEAKPRLFCEMALMAGYGNRINRCDLAAIIDDATPEQLTDEGRQAQVAIVQSLMRLQHLLGNVAHLADYASEEARSMRILSLDASNEEDRRMLHKYYCTIAKAKGTADDIMRPSEIESADIQGLLQLVLPERAEMAIQKLTSVRDKIRGFGEQYVHPSQAQKDWPLMV
jgi:hypothetical protein